jgi:ATP-dependent DNA ligase
MRREKDSKIEKRDDLEYHIFDVFFPFGKKEMPYIERKKVLDDIFEQIELKHIKKVETFIANDKEEEDNLYKRFLNEKYEGSILRNLDARYEFGTGREIRTYQIRKRKPRYSAEYEIIGYTQGEQGKDKGAIIWILTTKGDKDKKPVVFTSTPVGMDYEERYKLFEEMTPELFKKNYKGKMMTVEYDDISDEGVPLRAKSKNIRILD